MHKRDIDPNTEQTNGSASGSSDAAAPRAHPPNMWAIDWSTRPVEELQEGITAALEGGGAKLALHIADVGLQRFPDNQRFARITRLLAPPKVRIVTDIPKYDMEPCYSWLHQHVQEYRGQWVAVHEGHLLAHAPTLKALEQQIDPKVDKHSILMTRVLP